MAALEIACFSPESGVVADEAGASRIELCANHDVGGTTPPEEWLSQLKSRVRIPVVVMIRPRGGDFQYSEAEFESMKSSIMRMKTTADGFVFGVLIGSSVDVERTGELVRTAQPLPCTFHRAFDEMPDADRALEEVIATGCRAVLSSGGAHSAIAGVDILRRMVERAGGRITIIPGGGVRTQHLARLRQETRALVFHSSALSEEARLPDAAEVRQMVRLLSEDADGAAAHSPDEILKV